MSEIHNELVKVAGDLTASKERVKKHVLKQAHINRRKPFRFTLLTVVLTLCVAGFVMVQLLTNETKQTSSLFHERQLEHFERISQNMRPGKEQELYKEEAYLSYEKLVASYYFAKSLGIDYSKDDLEVERKKQVEQLEMLHQSPGYEDFFQGLTAKQYVETYLEPLLPMYTVRAKLYDKYKEKYPSFYAYQEVATIDAKRYFQANFAEQATTFQMEHNIKIRSSSYGSSKVGTVAKVESNVFLFVEGVVPDDLDHMTEEQLAEKYEQADWYPMLDDFPVKQGDYITLTSMGTGSIEENGVVRKYGLLNKLEVLEPAITKKLELDNEQEVAQFLRDIPWQPVDVMKRPPEYSFQVEGVRIEIWNGYGGSLYIQKVGSGEIQLSANRAKQLKVLLGIDES
ncbi:hypothetical protein [Lysinibacillus sp.]|uniref:hypothetical protein n=1 Tax=Lysinibacillus sp. TaxID=1869345 RepID=UPI0028A1D55B|nr:hypothetical protein [Lysinibacillus sp.]